MGWTREEELTGWIREEELMSWIRESDHAASRVKENHAFEKSQCGGEKKMEPDDTMTTSKNCKDCEHWVKLEAEERLAGTCESSKLVRLEFTSDDDFLSDGLNCVNSAYYRDRIVMGPEFGCVHFRQAISEIDEEESHAKATQKVSPARCVPV